MITSPTAEQPYQKLKTELVQRLSTSREKRFRQLLMHEEMGERKPSQFLRHIKSLATDAPDDILRSIWTNHLPLHIQVILAGQSEGTLDSASQLADSISEVAHQHTTASVSPTSDASLIQRVEELSRQVAALTIDRTRRSSHSRDRRITGSLSTRGRDSTETAYCWYHRRFRDKAQKCRRHAPSARLRKTTPAGVDGGKRLQYQYRPSFHYRLD